ncbi:hypothetical protein [Phenylobacterium sp.]|uniref:hypothetical protein n=1 Tax=Phenylobacterium sp. TaxID=1871053 RepID=UPI0025E18E34|nr:hypothetical protein [Phenylobacterium sp.]
MNAAALRAPILFAATALAMTGCQTVGKPKTAPPPPAAAPVAPAPPTILVMPSKPPPPPPPRSCVPRNLPPPPRYPDTDAALRSSPGAADRYQLMAAGRILRQQRLEDLERVVQNCR